MRARKVYQQFLNEEKVLTTGSEAGEGGITIYKNPPSITRMSAWARAFHDQNGNFYIADEEYDSEYDRVGITHTGMINLLKNKFPIKTYWRGGRYLEGIGWQRYKKTNKFYLAESYEVYYGSEDPDEKEFYEETMSYIKKLMNSPNFYEPSGAKFILEVIDNLDYQESEYDRWMKSQAHNY